MTMHSSNLQKKTKNRAAFIRDYLMQNYCLLLALVLITAFSVRVYLAINWVFDPDEAFYLYDSHLILNGLTPFKDFFTRAPFLLYPLAGLLNIFGESYVVGRLLSVTTSTITIFFVYLIGNKLYNRTVGLLSSFLFAFSPFINRYAYTIVSEPTQLMFVTIAMYMLVLGLKTSNKRYFLLNGIFLAASILVRKSAIVFIFSELVFLLVIYYGYFSNIRSFKLVIRDYSIILLGVLFIFLPVACLNYEYITSILYSVLPFASVSTLSSGYTEEVSLYRNVMNEMGNKAFYLIMPAFLFLLNPISASNKKTIGNLYKVFFSLVALIGLSKVIETPFLLVLLFCIIVFTGLYLLVLIYTKFIKDIISKKVEQNILIKIIDAVIEGFDTNKFGFFYKVNIFLIGFVCMAILSINFASGNIAYIALFSLLGILLFVIILMPSTIFRDFAVRNISEMPFMVSIIAICLLLTIVKFNFFITRSFLLNFVLLSLICMAVFYSKLDMKLNQRVDFSNMFLVFWFFSIFIFYFLFYRVYYVYMYELASVACIMTAVVVYTLRKSMPKKFQNSVNVFVVLLVSTMLLSQAMYIDYNQSEYTKPRQPSTIIAVSDYISEHTSKDEEVFAAWAIYPFQADRKQILNLSRPLYSQGSGWIQHIGYPSIKELIEYIDYNKVKYVIADDFMESWIFSFSPEFEQYINENYRLCKSVGSTKIYVRI